MKFNRKTGKELMERLLLGETHVKTREHCTLVGERAYGIASKIKKNNPDINIDPELIGFLGYVHDVGKSLNYDDHELLTIKVLIKEGIQKEIADMTLHGQLFERYGDEKYLPKCIEGEIVNYADNTIKNDVPISIERRVKDFVKSITKKPELNKEKIKQLQDEMISSAPRIKTYEKKILKLAGINNYKKI